MLAHCHGLLGPLNRTEVLLMLVVVDVPFLLCQNVCCEKGLSFSLCIMLLTILGLIIWCQIIRKECEMLITSFQSLNSFLFCVFCQINGLKHK